MAVMFILEAPLGSTEIYDKVGERLKEQGAPPPGLISHVAAKREGGGLVVVEVWETEEARAKAAERIDKAIEDAGGPRRPQPQKYQVHNIMTPGAAASK